jgi:hypothetical protein
MKIHSVQHNCVVSKQFRQEEMLNIKLKNLSVNRAFNRHRRLKPTHAQGADDRDIRAVMSRIAYFGALPA